MQHFISKDYTLERRRAIRDSATGWSRVVWHQLAELGVLAVSIDERHGGLGYGAQETGLVLGAFGPGLLLEPYLAAAVIASALIRRAAGTDFQAEWLPRITGTGDTAIEVALTGSSASP